MCVQTSFAPAATATALLAFGVAAAVSAPADAATVTFEVNATTAYVFQDGAYNLVEDYAPETFVFAYTFDPGDFVSVTSVQPGFSTFVSRAGATPGGPGRIRDFTGDATTVMTRHNQFEGDETTLNQKVLEFRSEAFTYTPTGAPDEYDVVSASFLIRRATSVFDSGVPLAGDPLSLLAELLGGSFIYFEEELSGLGYDLGGTGVPDDFSGLTGPAREGRARVIGIEGLDLPPGPVDVPEPAMFGLLGLGVLTIAARRRGRH